MERRARELARRLCGRERRGSFDFTSLADVQRLLGWSLHETVATVEAAEARGWLKSFGPADQPLGISLRPEGVRVLVPERERPRRR